MTAEQQKAYDALLAKDYKKAFELYSLLKEQKDPTSYYYLGFLHFRGLGGVEKNTKQAFEDYLDAATREVPVAQFEVALMLESGEGCKQNFSEAAFWYEEAAKRGNTDAFNNLAAMFKEGQGVEQDYKKAYVLFKKAAIAGNASAQFNLGALYDMGLGCKENKEKAIEWCRKASGVAKISGRESGPTMQNDGQIVF